MLVGFFVGFCLRCLNLHLGVAICIWGMMTFQGKGRLLGVSFESQRLRLEWNSTGQQQRLGWCPWIEGLSLGSVQSED